MEESQCPVLRHKHFDGFVYPIQQKAASNDKIGVKLNQVSNCKIGGYATGNNESTSVGGHRNLQSRVGLSISDVFGSKIGWQSKTSPQFKAFEPFFKPKTIPPHKSPEGAKVFTAKRLFSEVGSIQRLPARADKTSSQTLPCSVIRRPMLSNDGTSIRTVRSPSYLCSSNKLGGKLITIPRSSCNRLLRRFSASLSRPEYSNRPDKNDYESSGRIGMGNKLGKVTLASHTQTGILRRNLGYGIQYQKSEYNEDKENRSRIVSGKRRTCMDLEKGKIPIGASHIRSFYRSHGTSKLPLDSEGCKQNGYVSTRPKSSYPQHSVNRRKLVDEQPVRSFSDIQSKPNSLSLDRCVRRRMGSRTEWRDDVSSLEFGTKEVAHKRQGTFRGSRVNKVAYCDVKRQGYSRTVGQSNCDFTHKTTRRDQINRPLEFDENPAKYVYGGRYNSSPTIHSRKIQFNSRRPLQKKTDSRVEPFPSSCSKNIQEVGDSRYRPVCVRLLGSGSTIRESESQGQKSIFYERFQSDVGVQVSLGVPSAIANSSSFTALERRAGYICNNSAQVEQIVLESGSPSEGYSPALSDPQPSTSSQGLVDANCPPRSEPVKIGGLEDSGWSSLIKDWSPEYISLIESSWRKSTLNTYESAWKRWRHWCSLNSICHLKPTADQVALFLGYLHKKLRLAPKTIKVHKSVICTFSDLSNAVKLRSHPIIARVIKGVELSRPPANKKSVWDVSILIDWLSENSPQDNNLFQLSRHVALLLLLSTGRRIHDLTLLHISSGDMIITESSLIFWPKFGSKTDSNSYRQSGWEFRSNKQENLNIPFWTNKLVITSESRRLARPHLTDLFITTRGVVKAASRSVIAGWVRSALESVGINASPGSIRSAVASKNYGLLPLDEVLSKGNWRSETTFFKHYFREIKRSDRNSSSTPNVLSNSFKILN